MSQLWAEALLALRVFFFPPLSVRRGLYQPVTARSPRRQVERMVSGSSVSSKSSARSGGGGVRERERESARAERRSEEEQREVCRQMREPVCTTGTVYLQETSTAGPGDCTRRSMYATCMHDTLQSCSQVTKLRYLGTSSARFRRAKGVPVLPALASRCNLPTRPCSMWMDHF